MLASKKVTMLIIVNITQVNRKMKKNKKDYKSRVEKNSLKNRTKRRFKKFIKGLPKKVAMNILYLLVGFLYAIYLLIRSFNNMIAKLFMRLPRLMKVVIIYLLIANFGLNVCDIVGAFQEKTTAIVKTTTIKPLQDTPTLENTAQIETKQEEKYICTLEHETACKIQKKAIEYGIDWKIAVSISKWETGHFTSTLYKNKNNVGGLYCNGGFITYNTLDEGVDAFISNLKRNYFDMGLDTLEKIQPKYCPIGAVNDPNGLNKNWLGGVTKIYDSLGAK